MTRDHVTIILAAFSPFIITGLVFAMWGAWQTIGLLSGKIRSPLKDKE